MGGLSIPGCAFSVLPVCNTQTGLYSGMCPTESTYLQVKILLLFEISTNDHPGNHNKQNNAENYQHNVKEKTGILKYNKGNIRTNFEKYEVTTVLFT